MKTCYYLEELHKEILLEEEDIQAVPESGRADEACDAIAAKDYIVRQFQADSFESLRQAVCRICDSPRIRSRHEALMYIVWMAALDIKERRVLRHTEAEVKITREDGFVWLIVPREKVRGLWETGTFTLYRLYADDSEAEIENKEQLEETLERGYSVGIEVGFVATMGYAARMHR
ncbi:MAG TPA: hypothetical protein H9937_02655 [Candidatus Alistipes stercorigallinarum]|jgi:hypothetical protein|nr:hypothetical protein [Candidatus Alistipes stercorigallinarum]